MLHQELPANKDDDGLQTTGVSEQSEGLSKFTLSDDDTDSYMQAASESIDEQRASQAEQQSTPQHFSSEMSLPALR